MLLDRRAFLAQRLELRQRGHGGRTIGDEAALQRGQRGLQAAVGDCRGSPRVEICLCVLVHARATFVC